MIKLSKKLVETLSLRKETISCMESCTGGFFSNEITNTNGSSNIFKGSIIAYSNEFKIKFGVDKKVIDKYTEYSIEVANQMAKKSQEVLNSNWGVGITRYSSEKRR